MRIRPAVLPTVTRGSLVWLPELDVDAESIKRDLTYPHPAHIKAAAARRRPPPDVPATIALYAEADGLVGVPRHWLWREVSALDRYHVRDIRALGRRVHIRSRITLRPHQVRPAAVLAVEDGILQAPCGSGKTVVLLHAIATYGRLALVLVHTSVLLEQWIERACEFTDLTPDDIGVIGMGRSDRQEWSQKRLVVGLVQSVKRGLPRALRDNVGLVVTDECFPGDTLVGGRRIDSLKPGDLVPSFDDGMRLVYRPVVRVFEKRTDHLVRIEHDLGFLTCTPSHQIRTRDGWKRADSLTRADFVSCFTHERKDENDVRPMRERFRQAVTEQHPAPVLRAMQEGAAGGACEEGDGDLPGVRDGGDLHGTPRASDGSPGSSILLRRLPGCDVPEDVIRDGGADEPRSRQRADEAEQPDEEPAHQGQAARGASCEGMGAGQAAGQRSRDDGPRAAHGERAGMGADHGNDRRQAGQPGAAADPLQDRRREPGVEGGDRDRRQVSPGSRTASPGPEEGRVVAWSRVDRVSLLERGSGDEFEYVCPGGLVFDLEVEGTHTYVADGVGVHNCHHASAPTWLDSILPIPAARRIGASATVERTDEMEFVFLWHIGPIVATMTAPTLEPTIWIHQTGIAPDPAAIVAKVDWRTIARQYGEAGGGTAQGGDVGWQWLRKYAKGETDDRHRVADEIADCCPYARHPQHFGMQLCNKVRDVNWAKLGTVLAGDSVRDDAIVLYAGQAAQEGRSILILVDRVKHAIRLAYRLDSLAPGCCIGALKREYKELAEELGVEVSPSGTSERRRNVRRQHMDRSVIIATAELVTEGFDKPRLDTLIDVGVYANKTRAVQAIGRILRPFDGKGHPVVIFFEDDHALCRGTMRKRLRALYREDYDVRQVREGRGVFAPRLAGRR